MHTGAEQPRAPVPDTSYIAFDSTDRSGGFIGTMYTSGGVNVAVELAREG